MDFLNLCVDIQGTIIVWLKLRRASIHKNHHPTQPPSKCLLHLKSLSSTMSVPEQRACPLQYFFDVWLVKYRFHLVGHLTTQLVSFTPCSAGCPWATRVSSTININISIYWISTKLPSVPVKCNITLKSLSSRLSLSSARVLCPQITGTAPSREAGTRILGLEGIQWESGKEIHNLFIQSTNPLSQFTPSNQVVESVKVI